MGNVSSSPAVENVLASAFCMHPTGRPFYVDTCQQTRGWSLDALGTGAIATTTTAGQCFNGVQGLALTSSGVASGYASLIRSTSLLPNMMVGMELNFGWQLSATNFFARVGGIWFGYRYYSVLARKYYAGIAWYTPANHVVQLNHSTVPVTVVDTTRKETANDFGVWWHNAKIVVDMSAKKYEKLYWDDQQVDLRAYSAEAIDWNPASNTSDLLMAFITSVDSATPVQFVTYFGNIILTME